MRTSALLLFASLLICVRGISFEYIDKIIAEGPYSADWGSIEARYVPPDWYLDAKFGFYTHWLISSVPAFGSEWYPREMYVPGSDENLHQIKTYGPLSPTNGFKEFIPSFDGKYFDANDWMQLFQRAGAKYAGPVGEHHDGFPMFNCSVSPYNAVVMGPKRDIAGLLLSAANNLPQKMYYIISSHRAWHFAFYNNGRKWPNSDVAQCGCPSWQNADSNAVEVQDDPFYCNLYCPANVNETTPTEAFMKDWLLRTCEMADSYLPDVLYFDWWIGVSPVWQPYLEKMAAFYYNRLLQVGKVGVINTKGTTMPAGTDVLDFERGQACSIQKRYWQTDTSISVNSWGYIENDQYKSAQFIAQNLVDIVCKNGGMLLNVGPPPNGTMPYAARSTLETVGDWLKVNGDAIYGTRPYHFSSEGATQLGCGSFSDDAKNFTKSDFRFTVNPTASVLYVVCMGANPGDSILVKSLGASRVGKGSVMNVRVLGSSGSFIWKIDNNGLAVTLPSNIQIPPGLPPVLAVYGMTDIQWDGIVRQGQDGSLMLYATSFDELNGGVELNVAGDYITAATWSKGSSVTWKVNINRGGTFRVAVLAASPDGALMANLSVKGKVVQLQMPKTSSPTDFALSPSQTISLDSGGSIEFDFEVQLNGQKRDLKGLQVAYVQLIPN